MDGSGDSERKAREDLQRAGEGDAAAARRVRKGETEQPGPTEAAEQEAADGPGERGLSR